MMLTSTPTRAEDFYTSDYIGTGNSHNPTSSQSGSGRRDLTRGYG